MRNNPRLQLSDKNCPDNRRAEVLELVDVEAVRSRRISDRVHRLLERIYDDGAQNSYRLVLQVGQADDRHGAALSDLLEVDCRIRHDRGISQEGLSWPASKKIIKRLINHNFVVIESRAYHWEYQANVSQFWFESASG